MSSKITSKHTSRLISAVLAMVMIVCLMLTAVMPIAAATNAAVTESTKGLLHIRMVYKHDNEIYPIQGGSCFLINSTTILTAEHVVGIDEEVEADLNAIEGGKYKPGSVAYQVMVQKDVPIYATLKKSSVQDDYAILTLNEAINRPILKLATSAEVSPTDQIYALGFPTGEADTALTDTYTASDVTVTDGLVQKNTEYFGTYVIQHGAALEGGSSGGPLVDVNGNVIGVNIGEMSGTQFFYAVCIDQIKSVLDDLFIEYTEADGTVSEPADTDTDTDTEETEAPTEAPTSAPTSAPTVAEDTKDETSSVKMIIIIAIIVLVLILIAVVVIIIVNSSKKPKGPKNPGGPSTGVIPPSAPVAPSAPPVPPYSQPYNRPPMPPHGAAPTMPSNDGAGETSVLNEGAGETTVLGGGAQATGFTLVKIKGGERININKPEFTLGKERRRVDYCISDNNSISRVHAKLKVRAGRCYITDLGSTNCTYVNGTKLSPNQEVILSSGDKIKLSDEEFEFVG